jgi:hypothetical protein
MRNIYWLFILFILAGCDNARENLPGSDYVPGASTPGCNPPEPFAIVFLCIAICICTIFIVQRPTQKQFQQIAW